MMNLLRASLAVLLTFSPLTAAATVRMAPVRVPVVPVTASAAGAAAVSRLHVAPLAMSAPELPITPLSAPTPTLSAAPTPTLADASLPADAALAPADAPLDAPTPAAPVATAARRTIFGSLRAALLGPRSQVGDLFDASRGKGASLGAVGLLPFPPLSLPNGTRADDEPTAPSPEEVPGVRFQTWAIAGERRTGVTFESRRELQADASSETSVEAALRAVIDGENARYGVRAADLQTVHVRRFTGQGGQADTFFALFRQVRNGLAVHGSDLSFVVKVLDGKPILVSQDATLFPELDVNTQTVLTDEQIMDRISARTGATPADLARLQFVEQKIIFARGRWHAAKLYMADGLPFMIAVNVADGTVFAWDNRAGLQEAKPAATGAKISGRAVDAGPILTASQISEVPLPYLSVKLPNGKTVVTDKEGRFTVDASLGLDLSAEVVLTAELAGPYAKIEDQKGKTPTITIKLIPGQEVTVVVNPDSQLSDERVLADINAFHKVNMSLGFLRERKLTTAAMDKYQIPVRVNIDDECNAYFVPGPRSSLNFFYSSKNCVNSAYDTVAEHENGHYWDDKTGGIKNGGLSEGWGDILSMFRLNNPVIGEHFLRVPRNGVDYIRVGDDRNLYQYNQYDEVHEQGQAWGGFAWKLRKMLIDKLGYAQGAALAEALVLPTMFAKAKTIPDAMAQVLVNAMKNDGTILHEKDIRAAAKIHGVTLPENPGTIVALVRWTLRTLGLGS